MPTKMHNNIHDIQTFCKWQNGMIWQVKMTTMKIPDRMAHTNFLKHFLVSKNRINVNSLKCALEIHNSSKANSNCWKSTWTWSSILCSLHSMRMMFVWMHCNIAKRVLILCIICFLRWHLYENGHRLQFLNSVRCCVKIYIFQPQNCMNM